MSLVLSWLALLGRKPSDVQMRRCERRLIFLRNGEDRDHMLPETLRWVGGVDGHLDLVDQRLLPGKLQYLRCANVEQVYHAIKDLAVRGAPAIGVTAGYGALIAARRGATVAECLAKLREGSACLNGSRPTAVNLSWALGRMGQAGEKLAVGSQDREAFLLFLLDEAKKIDDEDRQMCRNIGKNGEKLIKDGFGVLTHCNAGSLATSYYGTALAVIYEAKATGRDFTVYVDETRPVLQGARLTYWELRQAGVDAILLCDNMAGYAMQLGKVNMVVTGADRIAANGDVANKIGTYSVAVLAAKHNLPFYVAAPLSTFDLSLDSGADIPIEERSPDEVRRIGKELITVADAAVWSPAFDVTPAELITAIITDRGVIDYPNRERVALHFASASHAQPTV
jgi:methylthioribose-1-phosphate isomerase